MGTSGWERSSEQRPFAVRLLLTTLGAAAESFLSMMSSRRARRLLSVPVSCWQMGQPRYALLHLAETSRCSQGSGARPVAGRCESARTALPAKSSGAVLGTPITAVTQRTYEVAGVEVASLGALAGRRRLALRP